MNASLFYFLFGALTILLLLALSRLLLKRRLAAAAERRAAPRPAEAARPPEESLRDAVTQLYNRKHLLRRLHETMARCDRSKETAAIILWDIDGFVDFNNRYGQKEGDVFLRKVGETIRRSLRVYDEAFRSGADEFCAILLPGDADIAREVTQRVNQIMAKDLFEGDARYAKERFAISSGIVMYPSPHKLPEALLYAAGEALYQNRNRAERQSVGADGGDA